MQTGEVEDPCMARMYPDFEALTEDGRFETLARQVYAPLKNWTNGYVRARLHEAEQPTSESAE